MFTPKKPCRLISGQDDDSRLMLTINVAGSTDSDDTDVTVIPVISLARPAVMTLTPPARWRMAPRKSSEATFPSIRKWRTAEFISASLLQWFAGGFEQVAQDRAFQCREI